MILNNKNLKKIGNYQLLQIIGKGANGVVYKGLNNQTGRSVAIKQVPLSHQQLKPIQSQIYLLRQLNHNHIVKYIDVLQSQNCLHIVLEYIEGGSLGNLVKKYPLPEHLAKVYIKQVLSGLDYLHQMGVVHRDIKGANILLTKQGIVKVADFGVAIRLNEDHKSFSLAGTPYWMAPQIIESKGEISTSCDIWSLGCTVIQLLTGNPPYFDLMQYPALFRIVQDQHPPLPQVSPQCKQFLLKCFKKQPELRLTASQLMKQTWLDNQQETDQFPLPSSIALNIKQLIIEKKYDELGKCITKVPTKKLIYHNPKFIEITYDNQNQQRSKFIYQIIKQDWQSLKYMVSIGLIDSVMSGISPKNKKNALIVSEIIYQIACLCIKNTDLSIFTSSCLKMIRKLFNLIPEEKITIDIVEKILSQQIIVNSHIIYILCKELVLNHLFIYLNSSKLQTAQTIRILNIIMKCSSVREPQILLFFKPHIKLLLKNLEILDNLESLHKIIKIIHNLCKEDNLCNFFENQGLIPKTIKLFSRVTKNFREENTTPIIQEIIKLIETCILDINRKEQFILHGGREIIISGNTNFKKQIQEIMSNFDKKVQ